MTKCHLTLALILTLGVSSICQGQKPTIQDCLGAIPICAEVYSESNSLTGSGNYPNEINGSRNGGISCMEAEISSIWYTFTVNKTGNFGFILTPNDPNDDYDWALFNITKASCEDIYNDISLQVSCNAAGGETCNGITGADGKTMYDLQGGGCGYNPPDQYSGYNASNDFVPVLEGNTYVLVVSNWTESTSGYQIDFSVSGDLGIFDNRPPEVDQFTGPVDCNVNDIELNFTENIQLNSINSDQFLLVGPDGDHQVSLQSNGQNIGSDYEKNFQLNFDPPISEPGFYRLDIRVNGTTDILDLCGNPLQTLPELGFQVEKAPLSPIKLPGDTVLCDPSVLILDISNHQATHYSWNDSITQPILTITNPGVYKARATNSCGSVEATIEVSYVNCESCDIFIPNAFSPNGDQVNDQLVVYSNCELQNMTMTIFDRWGGVIFRKKSLDGKITWNGEANDGILQSGTYLYLVQYEIWQNGTTATKSISGDFALLR